MYAVEVRDRIMIAHSLPDPFFGPAQGMHGATFVVDVAFFRETADQAERGRRHRRRARRAEQDAEAARLQNLDALPEFKGKLTTTEFLCRHIFDAVAKAAKRGRSGRGRQRPVENPRDVLHETDLARAWFEGPVVA